MARVCQAVLLLLVAAVPTARGAGDTVKGEQQFAQCAVCHSTAADADDTALGPNLHGVIGKKAGSNRPGYAYSDALKNSAVIWSDDKLDAWLKNPAQLVPGNKMAFVGLGRADTRANIIAYLKGLAPSSTVSSAAAPPSSGTAQQALDSSSAAGVQTLKDCAMCPKMVVIPAGSFEMGSSREERLREGVAAAFGDREEPRHTVRIAKPFAISRAEITRGEYAQFVAESKRTIPPSCGGWAGRRESDGYSWRMPGFPQTDADPVTCVSATDADDYAAWLSKKVGKRYRVPSEAEWEYAARGGTTTARHFGDSIQAVCGNLNIMTTATFKEIGQPESWKDKLMCASDEAFTAPVGSFEPNAFGVHDMLGSQWEWVADCGHPNYQGAPTDGSAWRDRGCNTRLVRGGAFHSEFWLARSATRGSGMDPNSRPVAAGIRVVREMD